MGMKVGFGNYGETVSPSDFTIVTWTHAYSFLGLMVFYFELKMMSMNLGFEKIVSRVCFVGTQAWLLYSFFTQIFLLWAVQEKKFMKYDVKKFVNIMEFVKIVDKVVENLTRGR